MNTYSCIIGTWCGKNCGLTRLFNNRYQQVTCRSSECKSILLKQYIPTSCAIQYIFSYCCGIDNNLLQEYRLYISRETTTELYTNTYYHPNIAQSLKRQNMQRVKIVKYQLRILLHLFKIIFLSVARATHFLIHFMQEVDRVLNLLKKMILIPGYILTKLKNSLLLLGRLCGSLKYFLSISKVPFYVLEWISTTRISQLFYKTLKKFISE